MEFHSKEEGATAKEIGSWQIAVKKITVNGTEYSECAFLSTPKADTADFSWTYATGSEKVVLLGGSAFKDGDNKIVISAEGYQDFEYTIAKEVETPDQDGETPPTVNSSDYVEGTHWDPAYYHVTFSGDSKAVDAYLGKVSEVTAVEALTFKGNGGFSYSSPSKEVKIGTNSAFGSKEALDFTVDCFNTTGNTTVVVKADGYADLTFTVNQEGKLVVDDNSGTGTTPGNGTGEDATKLMPPAFSSAQKVKAEILSQAYTRISFVGETDTIADYLKLLESNNVTVNGVELKKTSTFWNSENEFKLGNDSINGGKYVYLDITEDSFNASGNSTVVISAEGYNDLTFTIDAAGNLITE